jgi:hypothetical protein
MAGRAHQRASVRNSAVEEDHGEIEELLDDFTVESDEFMASKADQD